MKNKKGKNRQFSKIHYTEEFRKPDSPVSNRSSNTGSFYELKTELSQEIEQNIGNKKYRFKKFASSGKYTE